VHLHNHVRSSGVDLLLCDLADEGPGESAGGAVALAARRALPYWRILSSSAVVYYKPAGTGGAQGGAVREEDALGTLGAAAFIDPRFN
jgi:hypothetical protein